MLKFYPTLLTIVFIVLLSSCIHSDEAGVFHPIDSAGWQYGDTLNFRLEETDSLWHGDIAVVVRHSAAYPYNNIWLELSYPPTDSITPDSVNIILADDFGHWLGRGLGLSYQKVDTVIRDLTLSSANIGLRHIMRNDKLTDIEQIGIIFKPTGKLISK